ncbi:type 1 glycerol-3-phosphate oxidase [Enterococcus quebecensis]|uniref:Alpha-glycerophosphate oxidase n=1 Tax=Enterococcus quebecensis TaxID=903983 RepID=A0A1E5GQ56_9ENTE|nr:type 1 glycerol-3-phosphate oxidase [Enterococcus quebecensis]OEG14809.1 alpha-glycerophosphate oxidase [Enterococcus quebecensis]OJG73912.1 alpha-glycerophosphate oxidase [Enterococcus quebecensis]
MTFSIKTRQESIEKLKHGELDLLIIGGGITGAGVALQASAAGMKTGLIEMQDFAEGTSSRSTKLVHGGIRYLKNFDVEVVADTVQERAVVQAIAPHIPKPDPMLLPIYDEPKATFNMFSVKVAMDLYDRLANVIGTKYENYTLTKEEVLEREPQLKSEGLQGGGVYLDFRNNDARLVIENIKQASQDGGLMVSKVKAVGFIFNGEGKITGVKAKDLLTDEIFEINAKVIINTTGPWSDKVRGLDTAKKLIPQMRPTKGVHLVVDSSKLFVPQPTYFDTGKHDGRMVFVVPREKKTYFGTTDTDYTGDYEHPTVTQEDVDYLLEIVNNRYPQANVTIADIEASWAGLRPLISENGGSDYNGGNNGKVSDKSFDQVIDIVSKYQKQEVSRYDVENVLNHLEDSLAESKENPSAVSRGSLLERSEDGLLTLSGGKITDYRKMAEGALKEIQRILKEEFDRTFQLIDSKTYPVSGGRINPANVETELETLAKNGIEKGLTKEEAEYLAHLYGSNVTKVFGKIDETKPVAGLSLAETIALHYALENEMALTPADYLVRRTNHILFMRDTLDEVKQGVIAEMSNYYTWSDEQKEIYTNELNELIAESDLSLLKEGAK